MPLLSENPLWEQFATRTLFLTTYGGADFGDCFTTMQRIGDDGNAATWHREWTATADRLAAAARESEDGGHVVSAREGYLRAASYCESAALESVVKLSGSDVELVEIPFEGRTLPGLFARGLGQDGARGTIVHTNGYDSDLTEMFTAHVPAAIARGYDILLFDGPGQGRNLIRDGIPLRPDWESVVSPVLDWLLARPGVDPARVVLAGWSLGGFLAPRAAASEKRLAALIVDPGQWDLRDGVVARLPLTDDQKASFPDGVDPHVLDPLQDFLEGPGGDPSLRWALLQRGRWVNDKATLFDLFSDLARYRVSDVVDQITCPTLHTQSEGDPIGAAAEKLYDALTVERKALLKFTAAEGAGGHCEATARRLFHQRADDWLDETLG